MLCPRPAETRGGAPWKWGNCRSARQSGKSERTPRKRAGHRDDGPPLDCGYGLLDDYGGGAGAGLGFHRANGDHDGLGADGRGERNDRVDLHDSGDQARSGTGVRYHGIDSADGDGHRLLRRLQSGNDGRNNDAVRTLRVGLAFAGHIDGDDVTALFGGVEAVDREAVLIEDGAGAGTLLVERVNAGGGQRHNLGDWGGLHTGVFDHDGGGAAPGDGVGHHDAGLAVRGVDHGRRDVIEQHAGVADEGREDVIDGNSDGDGGGPDTATKDHDILAGRNRAGGVAGGIGHFADNRLGNRHHGEGDRDGDGREG